MKRILILLAILFSALNARAQITSRTAYRLLGSGTLPGSCNYSSLAPQVLVVSNTTYVCNSDGTYHAIAGSGSGTVTSVTVSGTANQINTSGTCVITTSGVCTVSLAAAIQLGTDNTTAGSVQMANGSANAHTIWGSGATTSNTILGFATAPTTTHLVSCTTASTTCTLTDAGGPIPSSLANSSHKWLNSFTQSTGVFTQTQPASTDLSDYGSFPGAAFGSQTANYMFAAPNGSSGNPTFRGLVVADLPSTAVNESAGTLGYLPKFGTIPQVVNSLCDEGATTPNTFTCAQTAGITASKGPVQSASDGIHAGIISVTGNTTVPASYPSNGFGFLGPNSASFTSWFFQCPATAPAATGVFLVAAVASNVSACSFSTLSGTGTVIPTTAAPTFTGTVVFSGNPSFTGTPTFSNALALGSSTATTQAQNDNSTKLATTAYTDLAVSNAVAGLNPAVAVQAATTVAGGDLGYTYSNGVAGIGATLTGANNTALTIDGYTFTAINQRLLVKNQTAAAQNGIYYVTQVQASVLPLILTRALDYDAPSDINNTGAIPVVNGTLNANTSWLLTSTVNTVGTDALTYVQFSIAPSSIVTAASNAGAANQLAVSAGANKALSFIDEPMVETIPFANCNAGTAGMGPSTATSNFTAACRAGSNNLGGAAQAIPSTGASLQFMLHWPFDADTSNQPSINIFWGAGANTSGTMIWTASSACVDVSTNGGASDDPAFNAESAFTTRTAAVANRMWYTGGQFTAITSGNGCKVGSPIIFKLAISGTAASNINAYYAVVTMPRKPVNQAN